MKSILVIDTPKSCSECIFKQREFCTNNVWCIVNKKINFTEYEYSTKRHPQCPLKRLPNSGGLIQAIEQAHEAREILFKFATINDKCDILEARKLNKILGNFIDQQHNLNQSKDAKE